MPQLAFYLFGFPRLALDSAPVTVNRRRVLAFASYLALTGRSFSRETLAAFFWPEQDERSARADLRRTLHELNRLLGTSWLQVEEERVQFPPQNVLWIDVLEFRRLLTACRQHGHAAAAVCPHCLPLLEQAVALYQDDFLAGFSLADSPAFDDWQFLTGEELRAEFAGALDRLVQAYTRQGNDPQAIATARRRLALDPLHEPAQRQLMQLYAWYGQSAAAIHQYEQSVKILAKELGVPPEAATTELYQAIKAHRLPAPPLDPAWQQSIGPAAVTLPAVELPEGEVRIVTLLSVGWREGDRSSKATAVQTLLAMVTQAGAPYAAQGTVLSPGDLLVAFGIVQAHEDDAERAVRMAVALQQAAQSQSLNLCIGISRGAAYCPRGAANTTAPVTGTLVTQATRLRNHASAQQILVDRSVYQATRGLGAYQAIDLHAPGLPTAYAVRQLYNHATKVRGIEGLRAELIGRQEEMSKLHAALTQAQQGNGQIVAIVGSAGVGKSRLVEELKGDFRFWIADFRLKRADPQSKSEKQKAEILWLEGRALEFASTTSYWLFADLLRGFWGAAANGHDPQLVQNLCHTLQMLEEAGHLSAADREEIGPLLGQLLAVRFGTAWDERLHQVDPNQLRQRILAAMQRLLAALACTQPLVLVFEDLHWADALSIDLIVALLEKLATLPLLLICVYRPESAQADNRLANVALHHCPERFTELRLRELTPQQSRQLVASLLAVEALPATMRTAILDKAQGNPLFLEEIVRVLIDNGQIYQVGATWQARATLNTFTVPDSLESVILSRLDSLPAATRQVLQMAAVLGRLFRSAVVAKMAAPQPGLEPSLRLLAEKSFIYLERTLPEAEYSFHHVLVRDAIYQALSQPQRLALHRQAGAALENHYAANLAPYVEEVAYHYDQADVADKAILYLLQAGEKARRAYHNDAAATAFQRALQRLEQRPTTPQVQTQQLAALTGLGQLAAVISQFAAAEAYLRQAITLSQAVQASAKSEAKLRAWLGDLLLNWQPRPMEALTIAETGLARLGADSESPEAAMLYGVIGWAHDLLGDLTGFRKTVAQVVCFLDHVPYVEELRPTYGLVTMAYFRDKDLENALVWMENAQRRALQSHDLRWYGESVYAIPQIMLGKPLPAVMTLLQEAHTLLDQVGDRKRANWLDADGAVLALLHGHLGQAQTDLERAVQDAQVVNQEHLADLTRWLGEVYLAQGEISQAIATLQQALSQYQGLAINPAEGMVALAYAWLAGGQRERARSSFQEALRAMGSPTFRIDFRNYRTRTRSLFANALCGLEEALADPDAFRSFCASFRAERPAAVNSPLTQWHLEPAQPAPIVDRNSTVTIFATGLTAPWQWRDPVGNATVNTTDGLQIETPNPRELWDAFLTAPCLLQPIDGDWVVQVLCRRPWADRPAIGGVLLWQDKWHFLRLDWGTRGQAEVALQGCVARKEIVIGRGHLPGEAIYLRLERTGDHLRGFCSSDGATWFSVGEVEFVVTAPVQIGLFTASYIERLIDPGAYPDGTAIGFTHFKISHHQEGYTNE